MPNRWIEFVKKWSSENNVSYGCALSKPEMKAEYSRLYPKVVKVKRKGVAKLEESRPPADVKSKVTYPNLSIRIPSPRENIQFDIQEMDDQPSGSKRGRPTKYMTEEEKYKAKLESNKQKRREKAAAAKKPELLERQYDIVLQILKELDRLSGRYGSDRDPFGNVKDLIIIPERQGKSKADIINNAYRYFNTATNINNDIKRSVLMRPLFLELESLLESRPPDAVKEKAAAKKVRGGMIPAESGITRSDTQIRNDLSHFGVNLKLLSNMTGKDVSQSDKYYEMKSLGEQAFDRLSMLKEPIPIEKNALGLANGYGKSNGIFYDEVMKLPATYKYENIPIK